MWTITYLKICSSDNLPFDQQIINSDLTDSAPRCQTTCPTMTVLPAHGTPVFIPVYRTDSVKTTPSLTHSSRGLNDRWGIKDDRANTFLSSSLSSVFRKASPTPNPVHSDIISSHLFFCLPFLLPRCTVPCRIIFASPVDLVMCP